MDMPQSSTLIPVLLSCDLNYLQHAAVCIASLATNNPKFRFHIIIAGSQDFTSVEEEISLTLASLKNVKFQMVKFDLLKKLTLPLRIHYSVETYTRLWIADFFTGYDRALFLDPDLVVTSAIDELWNADLADRTVAAVPIPGSTRPIQLGMAPESPYLQSGVLVFDLRRWRQRHYTARCLEILKASYVSLQEIERQIAERLPAPRSTSRKLDGMARDRLLKTIEHYGGGQRGVERARDHIGGAVSQQHVRAAFADREVPTEVADRISMRVATFAAKGFGP